MLDVGTLEKTSTGALNEKVDLYRLDASRQLDPSSKSQLGQFFTPAPIAGFMASLFTKSNRQQIRLLDAGAGIGSLSAAFITEFCSRRDVPEKINVTAYEVDPLLFDYLDNTFSDCRDICKSQNVTLLTDVVKRDFIHEAVSQISEKLLHSGHHERFTHAILNPPYKKIPSDSKHRSLLNNAGIEATNLYAAFVSLAIDLLEPHGELVAITPRSFCNGPYFKHFRKHLLEQTALKRIHIFESRTDAFNDDEVLQENVIFHCIKDGAEKSVTISSSSGADMNDLVRRQVKQADIVRPDDPDAFIYIPTNELDQLVLERINTFSCTLYDLNVQVSTGRVVDFRAKEFLLEQPQPGCVPLIYPCHIKNGFIEWPAEDSKKPNAIVNDSQLEKLFFPNGFYVVVNRFSPKEEQKRITVALYTENTTESPMIAFENHLNVFHVQGRGLSRELANGLSIYLNASLVDIFFRQFNGHTQVNAADLRCLPYPSREQLIRIGQHYSNTIPAQDKIDHIIEQEVLSMAKKKTTDPVKAKKKITQAMDVLKALGFPREQQNDRSALTLLALLDLKPQDKWSDAQAVLIGITPIMEFCKAFYGRLYDPNTRETFRRQTMHQFVSAGLVVPNPDQPDRPINSPKWCYQMEPNAFALIQHYGTQQWKPNLENYLSKVKTLQQKYAKHRKMKMIPVSVSKNQKVTLSPGKHNELIKAIIEDFAPRFVPGSKVIYVGDTAEKWGYFEPAILEKMGIAVDSHGKMPDVVLYYPKKDWLILVEAVTSHGPVDGKRQEELTQMFSVIKDKLVFVTAFPARTEMASYLNVISWETEVWVAEAPTHLIHFNGARFLGPYEKK